jgi:hypothetical protein
MRRILIIVAIMALLAGMNSLAAPNQQANAFQLFILETRTDLELLANEVWGPGDRIETWTFNADLSSDTVVADLWFDLEQLANAIYSPGDRPPDWFGATTYDFLILSRNIRHDLELAAGVIYGERSRPDEWLGALRIYQCDRTLQNATRLLDAIYSAQSTIAQSTFNFCDALLTEVEEELLPVMYNTVEAGSTDDDVVGGVSAIRGDVERLANELFGLHSRPDTWSGNLDEESPTMAFDVDYDLNLVADSMPEDDDGDGLPDPSLIGYGVRPDGWKLFVSGSLIVSERNMRHNLEMMTDASLGQGVRPHGWQGIDLLRRCSLLDQGLVTLLQRQYDFVIEEAWMQLSPDAFCTQVIQAANHLSENPPPPVEEEEDSLYLAESEYAFAYLDQAALDYMGIMPTGTEFRAWYRNYGESTMMFVSGYNFAVYVDMRWTTLETNLFNTLPTMEGVRPLTFCDANWCNGPGPTPTPTGGGPLMAVLNNATPVATIDAGQITAKSQVSWNHVRVTYLLDRPETGTVQVALEICAEPVSPDLADIQMDCEPVVTVYDNAIGGAKPVLSQFNGLNVYEFRYGYNSNVIIEGPTRISPDVWIADPTIR